MEFQPMERAVWAGARGITSTVGLQHAAFSRNQLGYFFSEGELGNYVHGQVSDASPVPDYCLLGGPLPRDVMLRNGMPADRMRVCGATRFNQLRHEVLSKEKQRQIRAKTDLPENALLVLVATGVARDESLELVHATAQGASRAGLQATFLFKCHYHTRIEDRIHAIFRTEAPSAVYRILDADGPMTDYIRASDIVVTSASSQALTVEVVAMGRSLILYRDPTHLSLGPVNDFPGTALVASGPDSLVDALLQCIEPDRSPLSDEAASQLIEQVFLGLDGLADARAESFLEEKGLL
jgi:surface carbohydrate biosynthesis protein (TIGR04326 family)